MGEISTDVVDIPVDGMFASADWKVICREGENFYRACGEIVHQYTDGGNSTCVKPVDHPSWEHEDYQGRTFAEVGGIQELDARTRKLADNTLKYAGLTSEQRFNTLNALMYAGIQLSKEP